MIISILINESKLCLSEGHGHDLQLPDRGFEYSKYTVWMECTIYVIISKTNERSEIGHTKKRSTFSFKKYGCLKMIKQFFFLLIYFVSVIFE